MKPRNCVCGAHYDDYRTGLTFADVRKLLWDLPDKNRPGWFRQKRRSAVLGYWHELKRGMWQMDHGGCKAPRKRRKSKRLAKFWGRSSRYPRRNPTRYLQVTLSAVL